MQNTMEFAFYAGFTDMCRRVGIRKAVEYAAKEGLCDGDYVDVLAEGIKPTKFYDVQIRVRDDFNTEMHIDIDDANAAGLKNGDRVKIVRKK